jgi:death-on-curing protein
MLGARYVEYIHDELIAGVWASAGAVSGKGCRDRSLLESAVSRPFQIVFGNDAYRTILKKGGALFHSLISNYPFHDGNKRTVVTGFYAFLLSNGHYFLLTNDEAYSIAKATASYRERGLTHDQILAEIEEKLRDWVMPFATLKAGAKRDSAIRRTFEKVKKARLLIRRSPLNRLVPTD